MLVKRAQAEKGIKSSVKEFVSHMLEEKHSIWIYVSSNPGQWHASGY